MIPETEIGDLIIEIRSATAGVGTFTAKFDHMAELTGRTADQIIAAKKARSRRRPRGRLTATEHAGCRRAVTCR